MKIGIVLSQPPGYSETFFNSKIEGLQKNGFEVTLFCQNNGVGFNTCKVKRFSKTTSNPIIQLLYFFTTISQKSDELVLIGKQTWGK